jgi:hypothetical protein
VGALCYFPGRSVVPAERSESWGAGMNDDDPGVGPDEEGLRSRLAALRVEHEDLDAAVVAMEAQPIPDQIRIARLKRKKLALRDEIVRLEDALTPDIIA